MDDSSRLSAGIRESRPNEHNNGDHNLRILWRQKNTKSNRRRRDNHPVAAINRISFADRAVLIRYAIGLSRLYAEVADIPGHIVEVGTGSGRNAQVFGELIHLYQKQQYQRYLGFDTFAGYTPADLKSTPHLASSAHVYPVEATTAALREAGVDDVCVLIPGDIAFSFQNALMHPPLNAKFSPKMLRVALLYIDCNSQRAASSALTRIGPHLSPGAIVAIDETIQGGETEALIRWAEDLSLSSAHRVRVEDPLVGSVVSAIVRIQ